MSRKRTKKQPAKSYKKQFSKIYIILILIIIVLSAAVAYIVFLPDEDQADVTESDDKWLFAMDTANIQYTYQASGIPTLVVIDPNGNVVYYNQGAHSKEQLLPYIESAAKGEAESLGAAPDFTVTTFNDEEFTLSDHQGEVVLLDIMGVGCPPCVMQMPVLQEIKKQKGEDITILSIDVRYTGETKEDVINTYGQYIKL